MSEQAADLRSAAQMAGAAEALQAAQTEQAADLRSAPQMAGAAEALQAAQTEQAADLRSAPQMAAAAEALQAAQTEQAADLRSAAQMAGAAEALQAAQAIAAGSGLAYSLGTVLCSRSTLTHYELQAQLGSGAFGEVWRCIEKSAEAQRSVAVKIVKTDDMAGVAEEVRRHKRAVEVAGALHIPKVFEDSDADVLGMAGAPVFMIAMQLIDGTAVNRLPLPEGLRPRECVANVVLHDVLLALQRLHESNIIHRDVKPANILVNRVGDCYLCDFGVSLFLDEVLPGQDMEQVGTPLYIAPEMLKTRPPLYDDKVDVWSLGVMGFELELGRTPLQETGDIIPLQGLIFSTLQTMEQPIFNSNFTLRYRNFVQMCLEVDPARRPSSEELVEEHMPRAQDYQRRILAGLLRP